MGFRVDPNGKIFTDRVRKETVACVVQTVTQRLRGHIFHRAENRVIDDFNNASEAFLAVTDAEILDAADNVIARSEFLLLNKSHVVWVLPADDADARDAGADA
jgi:hypothetical protein